LVFFVVDEKMLGSELNLVVKSRFMDTFLFCRYVVPLVFIAVDKYISEAGNATVLGPKSLP
jgi:hypothetical protein